MSTHTTTRTFATLRIIGKILNPQEVSTKLQLTPSEAKSAGDVRGKSGKWPHGYWELSSKDHVHSAELEDHLAWLVTMIEPSSGRIKQLQQEGFNTDIFCFWETSSSQGGITISPELLKRIGDVHLALGIDIYLAT